MSVDSAVFYVRDIKPFGNNPTFKPCDICKSKAHCASMGKCLLGESKKFASKYSNLMIMFGLKPEERSRFDKRRRKKELPSDLGKA